MRDFIRRLTAFAIMCSPFVAQATPILLIDDGGMLTGATGIELDGVEYDVYFADGSCIGLFDGCDGPDDFAFTTVETATAAAQALLDQVLVGRFDATPSMVSGCATTTHRCTVLTPWTVSPVTSLYARTAAAHNNNDEAFVTDWVDPDNDLFNYYRTDRFSSTYTYAVWSPAALPASVPEPWSLALWALGLAGVRLARRNQVAR